MGIIQNLTTKIAQKAYLKSKTQIAAHTYHLQFELEKPLRDYVPGKQLKVFVGMGDKVGLSDFGRTYSVWNYDKVNLLIDVAACTFSDGPGAKWVEKVQLGDLTYFAGPEGKFILDTNVEQYLFLGDISGLGHLYEIAKHIGDKNYKGFIYGNDSSNFFKDPFSDVDFTFIKKNETTFDEIKNTIKTLNYNPEESLVYIGGETAFCVTMNQFFKSELQWSSKRIKSKPFWHPSKKGLE